MHIIPQLYSNHVPAAAPSDYPPTPYYNNKRLTHSVQLRSLFCLIGHHFQAPQQQKHRTSIHILCWPCHLDRVTHSDLLESLHFCCCHEQVWWGRWPFTGIIKIQTLNERNCRRATKLYSNKFILFFVTLKITKRFQIVLKLCFG